MNCKLLKVTLFIGVTFQMTAIFCQPSPTLFTTPKSLFNGKDLTGFTLDIPEADTVANLPPSFIVRNGILVSMGNPIGHLITKKSYKNYRLDIEYRFASKPGNCGVLVHASTPRVLYKTFPQSLEVQMEHNNAGDFWCIKEDITVANMEAQRGPKAEWGTQEGKQRRVMNLTNNTENALGEWNKMTIFCIGKKVTVYLNNILVNDGYNCTASKGKIALQAEGAEVEFRKFSLAKMKP